MESLHGTYFFDFPIVNFASGLESWKRPDGYSCKILEFLSLNFINSLGF